MKTCKDCGGDIRRGWSKSAPNAHSTVCLICATARLMATFAMLKKGKRAKQ